MTDVSGRPAKPSELGAVQRSTLPPEVFDAFNRLIASHRADNSSKFLLRDAAKAVAETMGITEGEVYGRHLLDVEDAYRDAGWDVYFDRPAYNESYPASFTFTAA